MTGTPHISPFDAIRQVNEQGNEYWSARDLHKLLGYSTWQKFQYAIEQAKKACENSGQDVSDHFNLQVKMIRAGKGAKRSIEDYQLSRYACYLVVQNADPSKPIVAIGQMYFAVPTAIACSSRGAASSLFIPMPDISENEAQVCPNHSRQHR